MIIALIIFIAFCLLFSFALCRISGYWSKIEEAEIEEDGEKRERVNPLK